ncbi:MAG TPA: hypothetical protein VGB15_23540 [Longimicrobium sp.]|jgi:hypothetical protein
MKRTWLALPAVLALAACEEISNPGICPAAVPPSVQVTALDSVTSANVTPGATLVLANAAGVDSVTAPTGPITSMGVGGNRTGTFTVRVRQTGYQLWTKSGVKVEQGDCGARTVQVTARLQPAT